MSNLANYAHSTQQNMKEIVYLKLNNREVQWPLSK